MRKRGEGKRRKSKQQGHRSGAHAFKAREQSCRKQASPDQSGALTDQGLASPQARDRRQS
jgi:hypothetical protein